MTNRSGNTIDTALFLAEVACKCGTADPALQMIEHLRGKSIYVQGDAGLRRGANKHLASFVGGAAARHLAYCFPHRVFEFPVQTPLYAFIAAHLGADELTFSEIAGMVGCTTQHICNVRKLLLRECETLPVLLEVRERLGGASIPAEVPSPPGGY